MTALMTMAPQRRAVSTSRSKPVTNRKFVNPLDLIVITSSVLRPVLVTVAVLAASVASTSRAHADPGDDAIGPALDGLGVGNIGPISKNIDETGQSLCPMLVQPGSDIAGSESRISGDGGLAPPVAGVVAGMAIQAGCPGMVTSIAHADLPFPISGAMPVAGSPLSPQVPGMAS